MRIRVASLYTKFLLSFFTVTFLVISAIMGWFFYSFFDHILEEEMFDARAQASLIGRALNDVVHRHPGVPLEENQEYLELMDFLESMYHVDAWMVDADGKLLMKSFEGSMPPLDITKVYDSKEIILYDVNEPKHYEMYSVISMELGPFGPVTMHALHREMPAVAEEQGRVFGYGVAGIGLVAVLIIILLARRLVLPIRRLERASLELAAGDLSRRTSLCRCDEIGQLAKAFNVMAESLERMVRGSRELAANVSHELRSPLARIRVGEELARERMAIPGGGAEEYLDGIREEVDILDDLIGRILQLSKLDLQEVNLRQETVDMVPVLNDLVRRFQPAAERKGLSVRVKLPPKALVRGDRDILVMVVTNLLDNAIKHCPDNGRITLEMLVSFFSVTLRLTNTHEPLPEEDLERVFQPFERLDSASSGTGLGLTFVRKALTLHQSTIKASNSPQGFEVRVELPSVSSTVSRG